MTKYTNAFEAMRPYNNIEVESAMKRILSNTKFDMALQYLFPDADLNEYRKDLSKISSVEEFQNIFSYNAVDSIIKRSCEKLCIENVNLINKSKAHLFVANHRDIVLDSAILQKVLVDIGATTTEITFGSNLMSTDLIVDLGKANKMFTFYRDKTKINLIKNALLHSAYIQDRVLNKNTSIWIAQRDGRTKDGYDLTQPGLVKMLLGLKNFNQYLADRLNITPVAVSYEYEPCLKQKIQEIYKSNISTYKKHPNEDFISVITGITSYKGKVNISFGIPYESNTNNTYTETAIVDNIVNHLDREIYMNYKLWPFNFIAFDELKGIKSINNNYSNDDIKRYKIYKKQTLEGIDGNKKELELLFLNFLSNPILNRDKVISKENARFVIGTI